MSEQRYRHFAEETAVLYHDGMSAKIVALYDTPEGAERGAKRRNEIIGLKWAKDTLEVLEDCEVV